LRTPGLRGNIFVIMADQFNDAALASPGQPPVVIVERGELIPKRMSWGRLALALGVAGLSDIISFWTEFVPPVQWVVDVSTAFLLFLILGRRWALLPGLIAEAIPGMAIFPVWILVVLSIFVYDEVRKPTKKQQPQ
jgi:hypothetical protein